MHHLARRPAAVSRLVVEQGIAKLQHRLRNAVRPLAVPLEERRTILIHLARFSTKAEVTASLDLKSRSCRFWRCRRRFQNLAEGEGFEPPKACTLVVFKTTAIDHSAIPPATPMIRTTQAARFALGRRTARVFGWTQRMPGLASPARRRVGP